MTAPTTVASPPALAGRLLDRVAAELAARPGPAPTLGAALAAGGDDGLGHDAAAAGARYRHLEVGAGATEDEWAAAVADLAGDPGVQGVVVGRAGERAARHLPRAKDVDGVAETTWGRLVRGAPGPVPAVVLAVMAVLAEAGVSTRGRRVVVVGNRGDRRALALLLWLGAREADATVTLAPPGSADLGPLAGAAHVLVGDRADLAGLAGEEGTVHLDDLEPLRRAYLLATFADLTRDGG